MQRVNCKNESSEYESRRIDLPVPDRIAGYVGHVFVEHDVQLRVDITYPLDPVAYHDHLSLLQRVYLVELVVEKVSKLGAVVYEETIVYLCLGEAVVAELGVIGGRLDESVGRCSFKRKTCFDRLIERQQCRGLQFIFIQREIKKDRNISAALYRSPLSALLPRS